MYNIKKSNKELVAVGIAFSFIGFIILTVFSFVFIFNSYFYDSKANIKKIKWVYDLNDKSYSPKLEYDFDGHTYYCTPSLKTSNRFEIDNVYFNKSNPNKCSINYKKMPILYFIIIFPSIFIILGLIFLFIYFRKNNRLNKLNKYGILVKNIDCMLVSTNKYINGIQLYKIKALYTFPDGIRRELTGLIKSSECDIDNHQCDLVYLMEDYNIYCLDFDIERAC